VSAKSSVRSRSWWWVDNLNFQGDILPELRRLRQLEIIRLVDMIIVAKSESGELVGVQASDLTQEESEQLGAIAGALVGLGAGGEDGMAAGAQAGTAVGEARAFLGGEDATWAVADVIPPGSMAVVALIEHRWAIPLQDAVRRVGGMTLADAWVHPEDLVAYGLIAGIGEETQG
jgi:uncharacterized membrane protein